MEKYKVIDLFCGIGGFSYGFEMTKQFEVVCAADIWKVAIDTYKLNHQKKDIEVLLQDLTTLDINFWDKYVNKVDVIIAGPPCQGFSMSGKRQVGDKRNSLFEEVIHISEVVQPKFIVIENVVGLLSMKTIDGQSVKDLIQSEFSRIGYKSEFKVLNAADYGVPQARKRVVFIASKQYKISFPSPLYLPEKYVTVGEALGNIDPDGDKYLPATTPFQKEMSGRKDIVNHERRRSNDLVTQRMTHIPEGGNWKNIPKELGTGGGVHSNAYKRLDSNLPSITIKHAAKAMIIHPFRNRILSVREVARLQSFTDDFVLTGSNSDQHQQLANAVPPLLGKAIASELLKSLMDIPAKFRFVDLFCGMGGFRIAFEKYGGKCVFSSEIDKYACQTYYANFGEQPSGDITKIGNSSIPDFDILCAGFPCQPFSLAGLRKGFDDTRGTLFFEVARIIEGKKPKAFFLENVEGLTNHDNGNTIAVIEKTLDNLGYVYKWKIMNACEYGTPQNRKRWYCIGFRKDLSIDFSDYDTDKKTFSFPTKIGLNYTVQDIVESNVDDCYGISESCKNNVQMYLAKLNDKKTDYDIDNLLANEIRPSRCNFRWDGISPCLTAKMGTGGNNVPVYVKEMRKLTETECLKLMGFPSSYYIAKNSMHSYKQIGNSVVVSVISMLAKEIVRVLNNSI